MSEPKRVPKGHPRREPITVRFAPSGIAEIKRIAAETDQHYSELIRRWVAEGVARHNNGHRR